jgi:hypothetical protein
MFNEALKPGYSRRQVVVVRGLAHFGSAIHEHLNRRSVKWRKVENAGWRAREVGGVWNNREFGWLDCANFGNLLRFFTLLRTLEIAAFDGRK